MSNFVNNLFIASLGVVIGISVTVITTTALVVSVYAEIKDDQKAKADIDQAMNLANSL